MLIKCVFSLLIVYFICLFVESCILSLCVLIRIQEKTPNKMSSQEKTPQEKTPQKSPVEKTPHPILGLVEKTPRVIFRLV